MNFFAVKILKIEDLSSDVKRFTLVKEDGSALPAFGGGAHIYVKFGEDGKFCNAYSLCSSPFDSQAYQIAVKKELAGRGGSIFMHDKLKEGDVVQITEPNNLFALNDAQSFLLIGGGIGITPFMSQLYELEKNGKDFTLLYLKHNDGADVIENELTSGPMASHVKVHVTERGTRCDLEAIIKSLDDKTNIYACGTEKLHESLRTLCKDNNIASDRLHIEQFALADEGGAGFTLILNKSGLTVEVKENETVLGAIERIKGPKIECLCRAGACGTCELDVLEGEVDYNDQYYSDEERDNKHLLACCCRAKSKKLVIDL